MAKHKLSYHVDASIHADFTAYAEALGWPPGMLLEELMRSTPG